MKYFFYFKHQYLLLFGIITFGLFVFSGEASAHLATSISYGNPVFEEGEISLDSIKHGTLFKSGDPITFSGYEVDTFPSNGSYETVSCQVATGLSHGAGLYLQDLSLSIDGMRYLGIIPGNLVLHNDGKKYCEFNETFSIPSYQVPSNDIPSYALVQILWGVSNGSSDINYWSPGVFGEHIYLDGDGDFGAKVAIELTEVCPGFSGTVVARNSKSRCIFKSVPQNIDTIFGRSEEQKDALKSAIRNSWNDLNLKIDKEGNGSISFNFVDPIFNHKDLQLALSVTCFSENGKVSEGPEESGKASVFLDMNDWGKNCSCGPKPSYTEYYKGDTENLLESMLSVYSEINTHRKCEYECQIGYSWVGGSCVYITPQYSLSVSKEGPGLASCTPNCSSTNVNEGTSITLKAIKDDHAIFKGWSSAGGDNCGNILEDCSFSMTKDETIVAHFSCETGYILSGGICVPVEGQCNTTYTTSCYEGDLSSKTASDLCINSNFGTGGNPKYASGKWTWTCTGGDGSTATCETNQCARYKEVNP